MNNITAYRKYRCITEWIDSDTNVLERAERIINLADVIDYEEFNDKRYGSERTMVHMGINKPSIVIVEKFSRFEKIHDSFLAEYGLLDERSVKKNYGYRGMIKWMFAQDQKGYMGFMMPIDHDIEKFTLQRNMDFVISQYKSTYN